MPSFQDSALLVFLALILFGPKKLPELARQLGKLMAEFRRASNEFRMQMEDELRIADQEEQQKKIAAMQAAAPVSSTLTEGAATITSESTSAPSASTETSAEAVTETQPADAPPEPLPIATSGELNLMPPSTGLPVSNSALTPVVDSTPHTPEPEPEPQPATEATEATKDEVTHHG
jgi:sec-independent protein translocase protein TatB